MRSTLIILFALTGCATRLGNYAPAAGQSDAEISQAVSDCKAVAYAAAHTPGEDFARIALKASIVGIPAGIARERAIEREAWVECMQAHGFWAEAAK